LNFGRSATARHRCLAHTSPRFDNLRYYTRLRRPGFIILRIFVRWRALSGRNVRRKGRSHARGCALARVFQVGQLRTSAADRWCRGSASKWGEDGEPLVKLLCVKPKDKALSLSLCFRQC
jgi:hypothetical protein